jgi:hypothetical protein
LSIIARPFFACQYRRAGPIRILGNAAFGVNQTYRVGPTCANGEKIMRIKLIVSGLLLLGLPALGVADTTNLDLVDATQLPEPETLALLAIGAVGWAITRWTKRK